MKVLVVVDMQNDFIDGALGTAQAEAIVPKVIEKIKLFSGRVIATQDTHGADYLNTQEGKKLPVPHCIKGTQGWEIRQEIQQLISELPIEKGTFGSTRLGEYLQKLDQQEKIEEITFVGLCTDICVISNAMIVKAFLPETPIIIDAVCCAGVTLESHIRALKAMEACQITVEE